MTSIPNYRTQAKLFQFKSKLAAPFHELSLFLIDYKDGDDYKQVIYYSNPFGFHRTILLKTCFSRIVKNFRNFHFWISISKYFDFTFHFSKKIESICFSLCTSRKRVKAFFFTLHFSKKSENFSFSLFTSQTSKTHSRWSLQRGEKQRKELALLRYCQIQPWSVKRHRLSK